LAGQSAGLIDAVKSAKDIIDGTVAEFFEISGRMGAMSQRQSFN
jgi:enoyl-[acyl-carrier protein] reductase II